MLRGAALGRTVMYVNNVLEAEWSRHPYPPEAWCTVAPGRHEKSLEGTQASGAGESHAQEANVAEISYGEPVNGKPEYPARGKTPGGERGGNTRLPNAPDKQVTNGVVEAKQR